MYSSLEDSEIIVLTCNFLSFKFYTNLDISLLFFSADSSGVTWYCQPTCSVSAVYNDCACVVIHGYAGRQLWDKNVQTLISIILTL